MMRRRLGVSALALAVMLAVVAGSRPHLHAANGHRATADAHHAGDPARPLIHAHASPHHHHDDAPPAHDRQETEDIVAIDVLVLRAAAAPAIDPAAIVEAAPAVPLPVTIRGTSARLQPPANAPPPDRPFAPRAPPRPLPPFF